MSNKLARRAVEHQRAVVERRRSSAAAPHRSKRQYTRKEKYGLVSQND